MKKHFIVIGMQIGFLVLIGIVLFSLYPKVDLEVEGNRVSFIPINAKVIMISDNEDFSNPRYINASEKVSFNLKPGTYYWKPDNGLISGWKEVFVIESEVGLGIDEKENESDLVNIGNVKINISKEKGGVMVGHIVLGPGESESIENKEEVYYGVQDE